MSITIIHIKKIETSRTITESTVNGNSIEKFHVVSDEMKIVKIQIKTEKTSLQV